MLHCFTTWLARGWPNLFSPIKPMKNLRLYMRTLKKKNAGPGMPWNKSVHCFQACLVIDVFCAGPCLLLPLPPPPTTPTIYQLPPCCFFLPLSRHPPVADRHRRSPPCFSVRVTDAPLTTASAAICRCRVLFFPSAFLRALAFRRSGAHLAVRFMGFGPIECLMD